MRHLKGLEVGEEADDGDVLDGKGQAEAAGEEECFGDDQDSSDGSGNGDDWDKKRRSMRQLQQHKSIYLGIEASQPELLAGSVFTCAPSLTQNVTVRWWLLGFGR